jgi:DNA processing protein
VSLAAKILENDGLLVSEYKPNEPALTFHFPIRNRIIAGLCKAIMIVEATEKSGSMHTKNYALEYNREIFALPARVNDIYSEGCNKIIQNGQARMLLDSREIIEFFGKNSTIQEENKVLELSFDEELIYNSLIGHELHFDEISQVTKMETKVLATMLMRMEIKGIVCKLPGNYYSIK